MIQRIDLDPHSRVNLLSPQFNRLRHITISNFIQGLRATNPYLDEGGLENYVDRFVNLKNKKAGKGKTKDEFIDPYEAYLFAQSLQFGSFNKERVGKVGAAVFTEIRKQFFEDSPFDERENTLRPFTFHLNKCTDGDTCSLEEKIYINGRWKNITFRLSGIDTPESNWQGNGKVTKFKNYIWKYWNNTFEIPPSFNQMDTKGIKALVEDRLIYTGLLAGAAMKGVRAWAAENNILFTADITFNRIDGPNCGKIDPFDNFGRLIARLRVGHPGESNNLLAGFIRNVLPTIMAQGKGAGYYKFFRGEISHHEDVGNRSVVAFSKWGKIALEKLDGTLQSIHDALDPSSLMDPSQIFSRGACEKLAGEWEGFTQNFPKYKNDIQALLIFLGLGYAYPKYRDNNTGFYLDVEKYAMTHRIGLNGDVVFDLMRPNPERNPLALMFRDDKGFTDGKDLLPPDCRA